MKTFIPTRKRFDSSAEQGVRPYAGTEHRDPLLARCCAGFDVDVPVSYLKQTREKRDQGFIGSTPHRARGKADLEALAVQAGDFGTPGAGLDVEL